MGSKKKVSKKAKSAEPVKTKTKAPSRFKEFPELTGKAAKLYGTIEDILSGKEKLNTLIEEFATALGGTRFTHPVSGSQMTVQERDGNWYVKRSSHDRGKAPTKKVSKKKDK